MKVLSAEQTRLADQYTIQNEPISSIDLMERASQRFASWFCAKFSTEKSIHIFCGTGNNGGDGLAIARILLGRHYMVHVYLVKYSPGLSADCQINLDRLKQFQNANFIEITDETTQLAVNDNSIIIDGLFGSGLNRPIEGFAASLIQQLNNFDAVRVSIDIPSGLMADSPSTGTIFKADFTCTFQSPKLAFFVPENGNYIGTWKCLNIGLHKNYLSTVSTTYRVINLKNILLKTRGKFSHKGTYGHALVMAGSYGKIGAAVLASKACLKAGAGLVSSFIPKCGYTVMQISFPEGMCSTSNNEQVIANLPDNLADYSAIAFGSGVGKDELTVYTLLKLIETSESPLVIDADGLNIIAERPDWLTELPPNTIITPHPKEFERLFGSTENGFERLKLLQQKAQELHIIIVLKGAHTAIALPNGRVYFNNTGNPGMATAGTGDVLTGIITGLLSQQYSADDAACFGVFIHGLAADIAAETTGFEGLTAMDIINNIGPAMLRLQQL